MKDETTKLPAPEYTLLTDFILALNEDKSAVLLEPAMQAIARFREAIQVPVPPSSPGGRATDGAESAAYYANALDLVCDTLRTLKPEQFSERAPKLIAIIANAAHQLRAEPGVAPALLERCRYFLGLDVCAHAFYTGSCRERTPTDPSEWCRHCVFSALRAALVAPAESGGQP